MFKIKNVFIVFVLILQVNCKNKQTIKEKLLDESKIEIIESVDKSISSKWFGNYSFELNKQSDDWRNIHKISITIKKDSIIYLDEGYQLFHLYNLSAIEKNKIINLKFENALENTDGWALKKTKDFGQISFDGKNYLWNCPYVDVSFMDGKKQIYILKKVQN